VSDPSVDAAISMSRASLESAAVLIVALVVSMIIIYVVIKLLGEREGIGTAFLAALIGGVIYAVAYYYLGHSILSSIAAGIVWLLALKGLYKIGWLKAFAIAVLVFLASVVVGLFLPTLTGPI